MTNTGVKWWDEFAQRAEDAGHAPFSSGWYAVIRDEHFAQWPNADWRTRDNLNQFVTDAESDERLGR